MHVHYSVTDTGLLPIEVRRTFKLHLTHGGIGDNVYPENVALVLFSKLMLFPPKVDPPAVASKGPIFMWLAIESLVPPLFSYFALHCAPSKVK